MNCADGVHCYCRPKWTCCYCGLEADKKILHDHSRIPMPVKELKRIADERLIAKGKPARYGYSQG